jgi:hypothetical protein
MLRWDRTSSKDMSEDAFIMTVTLVPECLIKPLILLGFIEVAPPRGVEPLFIRNTLNMRIH